MHGAFVSITQRMIGVTRVVAFFFWLLPFLEFIFDSPKKMWTEWGFLLLLTPTIFSKRLFLHNQLFKGPLKAYFSWVSKNQVGKNVEVKFFAFFFTRPFFWLCTHLWLDISGLAPKAPNLKPKSLDTLLLSLQFLLSHSSTVGSRIVSPLSKFRFFFFILFQNYWRLPCTFSCKKLAVTFGQYF